MRNAATAESTPVSINVKNGSVESAPTVDLVKWSAQGFSDKKRGAQIVSLARTLYTMRRLASTLGVNPADLLDSLADAYRDASTQSQRAKCAESVADMINRD